jgi:flagellar L-ring protein precursor FlgH
MLILFILMTLFGCTVGKGTPAVVRKPYPVVRIPERRAHARTKGSLWPADGREMLLFADHKARKVGDVVTVQIVEESSATKTASTKTAKNSSLSASLNALFGFEKSVARRNSNFNPSSILDTSVANSFDGSGTTSRSGKVTGTIAATVRSVLTNGNLFIEGRREVIINNESQYLILFGVIRPRDISPSNTVLSTSIADARITYTGSGVISDKQQPGWFSRAVDRLWPF